MLDNILYLFRELKMNRQLEGRTAVHCGKYVQRSQKVLLQHI